VSCVHYCPCLWPLVEQELLNLPGIRVRLFILSVICVVYFIRWHVFTLLVPCFALSYDFCLKTISLITRRITRATIPLIIHERGLDCDYDKLNMSVIMWHKHFVTVNHDGVRKSFPFNWTTRNLWRIRNGWLAWCQRLLYYILVLNKCVVNTKFDFYAFIRFIFNPVLLGWCFIYIIRWCLCRIRILLRVSLVDDTTKTIINLIESGHRASPVAQNLKISKSTICRPLKR
jgi:hypothetical protein